MVVYVYLRGTGSSTVLGGDGVAYYYQTPGLNIAPKTPKALEYSVSYSFFHWGISAWATYALASLIMAYHFMSEKQRVKFIGDYLGHYRGQPAGFWGVWSI